MKKIIVMVSLINMMLFVALASEISAQTPENGEVNWMSYKEAVENTKSEKDIKIMLFLEADWCTVCKRMHREVFTDGKVIALLNTHFSPVKLDIESSDKLNMKGRTISKKEFSKDIGIYGTPTILFLDETEDIIGNFVGFSNVDEMLKLLNFISSEAYLNGTLEGYSYR